MANTLIINESDIASKNLTGVQTVLFIAILNAIAPAGSVNLVSTPTGTTSITFTDGQHYIDFAKAKTAELTQSASIAYVLAATGIATERGFKAKMKKAFTKAPKA